MPIYTYVCKSCGKKSEILVGITQVREVMKCEHCGNTELEKGISSFSVGSSASMTQAPCASNPSSEACSGCPHGSCSMH